MSKTPNGDTIMAADYRQTFLLDLLTPEQLAEVQRVADESKEDGPSVTEILAKMLNKIIKDNPMAKKAIEEKKAVAADQFAAMLAAPLSEMVVDDELDNEDFA